MEDGFNYAAGLTQSTENNNQHGDQLFHDMIDFFPDQLFAIDLDGKVIAWNSAMEKLTGVSAEAVLGKANYEHSVHLYGARRPALADLVLHPDPEIEANYCYIRRQDQLLYAESQTTCLRSGMVTLLVKASPLYDHYGNLIGAIESLRDITEQRNQQSALLQSEIKYQQLVQTACDAIFVADVETGIILDANHAAENLLGLTRQQIIGMHHSQLYSPDDVQHCCDLFAKSVAEQNCITRNLSVVHKDGHRIPVEISSSVTTLDGKRVMQGIFHDITEQRNAELALLEYEERYRSLVENAIDVIYTLSADGTVTSLNLAFEESTGWSRSDWIGKSFVELVHPDDFSPIMELLGKCLQGEKIPTKEWRIFNKLGEIRIGEFKVSPLRKDGQIVGLLGIARDVTERKKIEEALRESEEKYRLLFENMSEAVAIDEMIYDSQGQAVDWILRDVNHGFEVMTGIPCEKAIGQRVSALFGLDQAPQPYLNIYAEVIKTQAATHFEAFFEPQQKIHSVSVFPLSKGRFGTVISDITERIRAEEAVHHMAYHDTLTGLPNRALYEDRLNLTLAQARRNNQMLAVMFLDLDRFKTINDTLGHAVGDQILRRASARLAGCLREGDTMARMGGDEFTLLLPQISHIEDAARIAQRLIDVLKPPFAVGGREVHVRASIGISIYPHDGIDSHSLLRNADLAMYRAKEHGRNNYQLYTATMSQHALERIKLEQSLCKAVDNNELVIYYQPQVDLHSGQIIGMEALLRWNHPERGLLLPAEFIPVAEETGQILMIGEWVLRSACTQCKAWQLQGLPPTRVSINLSTLQFQQDGLIQAIDTILKETGLDPKYLELEATEDAVMLNTDRSERVLLGLKALGVRITLDNLGTGHSSISFLRKLPIDSVKIDRSFIQDSSISQGDAAVTAAIIALIQSLKMRVIAGGAETREQLEFVKQKQCDEMQGYLFSKAVPAGEIETMLREGVSLSDCLSNQVLENPI